MSTTIMGIGLNELKPSHDLELTRSKEGLWNGSQTYTCRYADHANEPIVAKLTKGTPITDLDNDIPIKYSFISVASHRIEHQRGGLTKVKCTFSGSSESDGFSGGDERSASYSYNGTFSQASILTHPNYLAEVIDTPTRRAIAAYYNGKAYSIGDPDVNVTIRGKKKDHDFFAGTLTGDDLKWFKKIHAGIRFYDKPEIEWTITETNKGGLKQSDLNDYGKKVGTPDGDPPIPSWATGGAAGDGDVGWWLFSSINEDKDENSSVYSRTYTLRSDPLDVDIFDY